MGMGTMAGALSVVEADGRSLHGARCSELRVLGGFEALGGGVSADALLRAGAAAQALKVLAVYRAVHVETIIEILWPDGGSDRGRVRLRNVLTRVRHAVGPVLTRDGDVLTLDPSVEVDAVLFEADARTALRTPLDAPQLLVVGSAALERYAGPLLPFDRYADWTGEPRERLRRRYLEVLDRMAAAHARSGGAEQAIALLLTAIDEEPEAEDRYLAAARLLLAVGRRGRALLLLRRLRDSAARWQLPLPAEVDELEREILA
jgi:DNA-binding SARP family transcriptional activator